MMKGLRLAILFLPAAFALGLCFRVSALLFLRIAAHFAYKLGSGYFLFTPLNWKATGLSFAGSSLWLALQPFGSVARRRNSMSDSFDQSEILPEIERFARLSRKTATIDPSLFAKFDVKRGLRDINGKGVLVGLTEVSDIVANKIVDGATVPDHGSLYYRGYDVKDLVKGLSEDNFFGFEETTYLLLFGKLPTRSELAEFCAVLAKFRTLPTGFVRDIIMKAPSRDMMNTLARSVLTLYSYDERGDDTSIENVMRQSLELISLFPLLSVYGYQAFRHYHDGTSLYIHKPSPEQSTAQTILRTLRPDSKFTPLEAKLLDIALILHADHGGGNNSTFATHLLSSSGTDTYSVIAASLGSLKGPKHGGANIMVMKMFDDMKNNLKDWSSEAEVSRYLEALLNKEAFDKAGLIYGMGHAVYSLSDPRAVLFRHFVARLSKEKGREEEFALYCLVERLAPEIISQSRKIYKGVSPNVDFYSGFAYSMLNLPIELYTPIFAISRISGWSAHRLEELSYSGRIMRPAYKNVLPHREYVPMEKR
jgi:citrate synthase